MTCYSLLLITYYKARLLTILQNYQCDLKSKYKAENQRFKSKIQECITRTHTNMWRFCMCRSEAEDLKGSPRTRRPETTLFLSDSLHVSLAPAAIYSQHSKAVPMKSSTHLISTNVIFMEKQTKNITTSTYCQDMIQRNTVSDILRANIKSWIQDFKNWRTEQIISKWKLFLYYFNKK